MDIGKSIVLEDGESGIIHKKLEDNWFEIMVNEGDVIKVQLEKLSLPTELVAVKEEEINNEEYLIDDDDESGEEEEKKARDRQIKKESGKVKAASSENPEDKIPPKRLISILREQVTKRNLIINAIREAYETDVITLRNQLYRWRENKPEHMLDQRVLLDAIPSLDFGGCIKFFEPEGYQLRFRKCPRCSGSVELIVAELHRGKREPTPEELELTAQVEALTTELTAFKDGAKYLKNTYSKEMKEMAIKVAPTSF